MKEGSRAYYSSRFRETVAIITAPYSRKEKLIIATAFMAGIVTMSTAIYVYKRTPDAMSADIRRQIANAPSLPIMPSAFGNLTIGSLRK